VLKIKLAEDGDLGIRWNVLQGNGPRIVTGKGLTVSRTLCKRTGGEEQFRPRHRGLPLRTLSLRMMFVRRVNPAARLGYDSERTSQGWMRGESEEERAGGGRR